jgi:plastocyanin
VHGATTAFVTVVAAEKSRVPFYIVGGTLAVWAVVVSVLLGLRKPSFPGGQGGQRAVIAISVGLVAAAVATAVLTSGTPKKSAQASAAASATQAAAPGYIPEGTVPAAAAAAPTTAAPPTTAATPPSTTAKSPTTATTPATSGAATQAATTVPLSAVPNAIAFNTKTLTAKAGKVTIAFTNSGALEHNVTIAQGSTVLGATPTFTAAVKNLTLTLKPGTYTFYCSVPGHRAAGMEGTLKVT